MVTMTAYEVGRLVLVMLACGAICGIPVGCWLAGVPTRTSPMTSDAAVELAGRLEDAADALRYDTHSEAAR